MAIALPDGDHESERMLGARPDGRPVSARTVVLMPLKVVGKRSFLRGREVFGGAMVGVRECLVYAVVGGLDWSALREGCEVGAWLVQA